MATRDHNDNPLTAINHTLPPKLEWTACAERMPEPDTDCLVVNCWEDGVNYVGTSTWVSETDGWEDYAIDEVSHWMPMSALPEVPKDV